jgi:hypothetical protein
MKFKIEIRAEAVEDLTRAVEDYESLQAGLGERFISCWEERLKDVISYPKIFAVKHDTIRTALIIPFPWQIVFEMEGEKIIVYQLFCAISDPAKRFKNRG